MDDGGGRKRPVWFLVIMDVLLLGVALNVFALFHHVIPRESKGLGYTLPPLITKASTPAPSPVATTQNTESSPSAGTETTTTPQPADLGSWGEKYSDKFTSGDVEKTGSTYKSHDINVSITTGRYSDSTYYVADIYIRNVNNFMSSFANDKFGIGQRETTPSQAKRNNAVVAVNGDNYGGRNDSIVVRNGIPYRDKLFRDVLVLYQDGTMKTIAQGSFDMARDSAGAWQIWDFGPLLLDDNGQPITTINRPDIGGANPRTAIGYYEPGHYCLVLVDGRNNESNGVKLPELSQLMFNLGCKAAYNLDGGRTSYMLFMDNTINKPYDGGRSTSDIIYIGETK